ncbi:MAG TPA: hypothetical protein DD730_11120 [Desulfosporosinus sp.]|nr:hypothetical protein [Desulfosporosinus sp.]
MLTYFLSTFMKIKHSIGDDSVKYQYVNINSIALMSLIGLTYFVLIIIAMHKLRSDYNPLSRYISEYAVGKYGQLAASSFVTYGLAILVIYFCLKTVLPVSVKSDMGLTLMAIWGVAVFITGFFNTDLKAEVMSLRGTVHTVATNIGVAASMICFIFLSYSFAYNEGTQSIALVTLIIAIIALILTGLLFLGLLGDFMLKYHYNVSSKILLSLHKLTGLSERLLVGISIVWLIIIVSFVTS